MKKSCKNLVKPPNSILLQYLNSGAGCIAGLFVHDKFVKNPLKNLHGWWSNKQETRFEMRENIDLAIGADAFRLSNPPPFLACLNLTSLKVIALSS